MKPERFVGLLGDVKASAILRCPARETAVLAMEAAVRGGFRIVEFTLTIPGALDLVEEFSRRPDLIVGAGTVLTTDEARTAVKRGARFLVSPVMDPQVISVGLSEGVAVIPGCHTPTEMLAAQRAGLRSRLSRPAAVSQNRPDPGCRRDQRPRLARRGRLRRRLHARPVRRGRPQGRPLREDRGARPLAARRGA